MNRITAILSLLIVFFSASFSAPTLISAGCDSLDVNPDPVVIGSSTTFSSSLCESVDGSGSFTPPYWVDLVFKDNAGNSGIITAAQIPLTVTQNPVGSVKTSSVSFDYTFGPTVTISGGVGGPTLTLIDGEQYKLTARFWDDNNVDAGASPEINVTFTGSGVASPLSCTTFTPNTSTVNAGETVLISISGCTPQVGFAQIELFNSSGSKVTYLPTSSFTAGTSANNGMVTLNTFPAGQYTYKVILKETSMSVASVVWNPTNTLHISSSNSPGFLSGLISSVIGVQCPPDTTYISIFDACLDFATTLGWGMNWALIIASLLAMVRFAIGAQQLIFSQGDPGKLQNGRETVTDAMLGLVLLAVAWIVFGYLNETLPSEWQIDLFTVFG